MGPRGFSRAAKALPAPVIAMALAAILAAHAGASAAGGFELKEASVGPARTYFAGAPLKIRFRVADPRERRLRVILIDQRTRRVQKRWRVTTAATPTVIRIDWQGKSDRGSVPRNGRYVVRAGPAGRPTRRLGAFTWRRHAFPVAGPHGTRGYTGEFGAARSGGRSHEGYDVTAPCGTRVVAARGGRVVRSRFDPRLMGNFVVIKGRRSGMRYLYAHLQRPSRMREGDRVRTATLVGRVGRTGNAATTPCHLHFELRRDGPIDPEPHLRRWSR